jgi:hypothetical protein
LRPPAVDAVPGRLVVGFTSGVSPAAQQARIEQAGGRLVRRLAHIDGPWCEPAREGG